MRKAIALIALTLCFLTPATVTTDYRTTAFGGFEWSVEV